MVRATESLVPRAREVVRPQLVPVLIPSVSDVESETAADVLASLLAAPEKSANGSNVRCLLRPRLRPEVTVIESDPARDSEVPAELV